ncbi:alpha/beta hydrolase [Schlesneria paludicola]|uniref:alpha/beta hydrolase n=1 Tax=Schlesneria paludicola TaxID=360056 RepID=UPI0012F9A4C5|nr:alpha/beta hydrolase [Schlesneria paludicola]
MLSLINRLIFLICLAVVVSTASAAPPEILLWSKGMPDPVIPADPPEKVEKGVDGIQRRTSVSQPRLFVHEPPADVKRTGAAVIVVPGGGFGLLADEHEGSDAAIWLAQHGIVGFQLAHRVPTNKLPVPNIGPTQDLQKSLIEVRRHATEYQVDPTKVGVLGFSAGGQVTLVAATNQPSFPVEANTESYKPDFLVLLYAYQIYDPMTKGLRSDINLDAGLPPTFIAQMGDDKGSLAQGSTLLYLELINRQIPAELHIYEKGGHGFGMRSRSNATGPTDWQKRAIDWLRAHEYIAAP